MEPYSRPPICLNEIVSETPPRRAVLRWRLAAVLWGAVLCLAVCLTAFAQDAISAGHGLKPGAAPPDQGRYGNAGWSLLLLLVLTLCNAMFSMAETALVAIRPSRVTQLVEEGQRGALLVRKLIRNPPRFIATTQFGITLLSFASSAAAASTLVEQFAPWLASLFGLRSGAAHWISLTVVTFLLALVTMILGEIAPKSLAVQAPDKWSLRLAPFVNLCATLFTPITAFVIAASSALVRPFGAKAEFETPMITREEFEAIINQGEKHGELDDDEAEIVRNVFDLSETPIKRVMTHRVRMTALPVDATLDQTLETILESGHSRIPVYETSIDNIVGIVHAKDLLPLFRADQHNINLASVVRNPLFVPASKRVNELIADMRRTQQQLAIVQDEHGGTEGLVTIEDLLEEIVGDIKDEYDVDEPEFRNISDHESIMDGGMTIDDVNDRLGTSLPHEEYDTIGGLVFGLLGHEPTEGEHVRHDDVDFYVERVESHRIRSLRAVRLVGALAGAGDEPSADA